MLKKTSLTFILLTILLVLSLSLNAALAYLLKEYYTRFRLAKVFPSHEATYQKANLQLPAKQQKRVVLFGDSRIEEWKNLPQMDGIEFINRGIGGETTQQLFFRFQQDVIALSPDIVIIQAGINDLVVIGVSPHQQNAIKRQCQQNLEFFVKALRDKAIQTIFLTIVPPARPGLARLPVWSEQIATTVEEINQNWLMLPPAQYLHVVDTKKVLQNEQGQWHDQVNRDTLHFTAVGYERLNQAITPILASLTQ